MTRSWSLWITWIVVFLVQAAAAQMPELPAVRKLLQQAVERGTIAGAVAVVSQGDEPLLFEAFGKADEQRPMTTDALFRIASMTKPITSVAVMQLVEHGRIRLDDPLHRYLPEFAGVAVMAPSDEGGANRLAAPKRSVTVRDLLTHTSGILYPFNATEAQRKHLVDVRLADGLNPENPTVAENARQIARVPLAHQPGAAWTYGLNTDVLGRLVEVASGKSFDQFLADHLFQPLRMKDTAFRVPPDQVDRLAAVYTPGENERARLLTSDPATFGPVIISASRVTGDVRYFSGGAGLVSTAADYARLLRMLLREGELDGVRILQPETVRRMTSNQIGQLDCPYTIHGDKFGLGFAVTTQPGGLASVGSYSWGGLYHTFFWVDPSRNLVGLVMTQLYPWGNSTLWADFQRAVYESLPGEAAASIDAPPPLAAPPEGQGRFWRQIWFEMGEEYGNPKTNNRFRVNDPLAALHPEFRSRSETKGNGMLQIRLDEPLEELLGARLTLELWGGHPGTAGKRVSVNGRSTYVIPEVGTAAGHCTHQYPKIPLERSDLVQAHNALQFACDRGSAFWGHFIVDNAALEVELPRDHASLQEAELDDFEAAVAARVENGGLMLQLEVPDAFRERIERVDFDGFYDGFDENGDGQTRDWHGMSKKRQPYGHVGTATEAPFEIRWDGQWLLAPQTVGVRATVRFRAPAAELLYETPALMGLNVPAGERVVKRFKPAEAPVPFWSRAGRRHGCNIEVELDPADIEEAELWVVVWDGGVEQVEFPLTLNGQPLPFKSDSRHDVKLLHLPVEPARLKRGVNRFEVFSDTTHHGIEVLLPGPELWVRTRASKVP